MDEINTIVATNLKRIRHEKNFSLDKVSVMAGVSKSMLGQIERGESSPTINMLWKIANGLKISFSELTHTKLADIELINYDSISPLSSSGGKFRLFPYFHYNTQRSFEMYGVEIDEGGEMIGEPHGDKCDEYITIFSGHLKIDIDGKTYMIKKGDAIRFDASKPHYYTNVGNDKIMLSMVITYK